MLDYHRRWDGKIRKIAATSAVRAVRQVFRKLGDCWVNFRNVLSQCVRVFYVLRRPIEFLLQERQSVGRFEDENLSGRADGFEKLHYLIPLSTRMMAGVVEGVASEAKRNEIARRSARMLEDRKMGLFHAFLKFHI